MILFLATHDTAIHFAFPWRGLASGNRPVGWGAGAKMLGLEALCLGNARYVVLSRLVAVAGSAEDLQIVRFV